MNSTFIGFHFCLCLKQIINCLETNYNLSTNYSKVLYLFHLYLLNFSLILNILISFIVRRTVSY